MTHPNDVSPDIVAKLALVSLGLPEAYQERAWVGIRWCVRKKTFAHVLMIADGWPPAYAQAAGSNGPITVLTVRSAMAKIDADRFTHHPFFRPVWFSNIVGLVIDDHVDWDQVGDLVTESYCVRAPKTLVALID